MYSLPGVAGVEPQLSLLADLWCASHNTSFQLGMSQRIYQLTYVTPPVPPAPGSLRPAGPEDVNLVSEWVGAFTAEAGANVGAIRSYVEKGIAQKAIYLWDDKGPTSMARWTGRTPHGVRVSLVYTPPEQRRRGYASACVAGLSRKLLDSGLRLLFLYTDLSNPTSNSIYQRIGYEPVCDVAQIKFVSRQ